MSLQNMNKPNFDNIFIIIHVSFEKRASDEYNVSYYSQINGNCVQLKW